MTREVFDQYMDALVARLKSQKQLPALLMLDNHATHLSMKAWETSKAAGLVLLGLPANSTALTQFMDRYWFKYAQLAEYLVLRSPSNCPLRCRTWKATVTAKRRASKTPVFRGNIINLAAQALREVLAQDDGARVRAGFERMGLLPLNPRRFLDTTKLDIDAAAEAVADDSAALAAAAATGSSPVTAHDLDRTLRATGAQCAACPQSLHNTLLSLFRRSLAVVRRVALDCVPAADVGGRWVRCWVRRW